MPRPRTSDPEQLQKLQARLERVQRQIRAARSREKDQARRDDARRKIIAGALALEHFEKNPGSEFARIIFRLLDEYARSDDRRLFAFLPARDTPSQPQTTQEPEAAE